MADPTHVEYLCTELNDVTGGAIFVPPHIMIEAMQGVSEDLKLVSICENYTGYDYYGGPTQYVINDLQR